MPGSIDGAEKSCIFVTRFEVYLWSSRINLIIPAQRSTFIISMILI